ncbi:hypothetical protein [Paenibacillus thiaminolyticus]|uniref:hypothetical protein n=1 Tax=Paenibacillus thiaminolyticus TaxID=49283 RepID=UPI00160059E0|nr:hypothetical protein [Paenibacillus thiaminolyticus]
MLTEDQLRGVMVPIVTPFDRSGNVDFDSFTKLIARLVPMTAISSAASKKGTRLMKGAREDSIEYNSFEHKKPPRPSGCGGFSLFS